MTSQQDSFFGCLSTSQILSFITQAEQELSGREDFPPLKFQISEGSDFVGGYFQRRDELHWKRAERFGIPVNSYSDETSGVIGKLVSSRKERPDYFDDTKVIRRNRKQRAEFMAFLDEQLDEYARERDRIYANQEREREREEQIFSLAGLSLK